MNPVRIEHLFVSPGHNYLGHHDQPAGDHPIVEVDQVECVAGRGLQGDRFFDFKADYRGQITFFAAEVLEALQRELGLATVNPAATRRNVITRGLDLNALIGQEFELQGVRFAGTEECRPCSWMNQAFQHEAAEAWLKGRGGLRAKILTSGTLRRDWNPDIPRSLGDELATGRQGGWGQQRSADLQSAVSQNCILRKSSNSGPPGNIRDPADCKSAIQQIANLRYVS